MKIASDRSFPILFLFTSKAATGSMSLMWYSPNFTCIKPGIWLFSSASL